MANILEAVLMLNKKCLIGFLGTSMLITFACISPVAFAENDKIKILIQECYSNLEDCHSDHYISSNAGVQFTIDGQNYKLQNHYDDALGDYVEIDNTFINKTIDAVKYTVLQDDDYHRNDTKPVSRPYSRTNPVIGPCTSVNIPTRILKDNTAVKITCSTLAVFP